MCLKLNVLKSTLSKNCSLNGLATNLVPVCKSLDGELANTLPSVLTTDAPAAVATSLTKSPVLPVDSTAPEPPAANPAPSPNSSS